jgi:hypothetical protein
MSFEGYYQHLCKRGHRTVRDVYDNFTQSCWCRAEFVFSELVDTTNDDGNPTRLERIDGGYYTCSKCGSDRVAFIKPIYKIPDLLKESK